MIHPAQAKNRGPKDRRRNPKKGYWSTTVTAGDVSVYAWERLDRGGVVHIKFASTSSSAGDSREKRKLPGDYTVRDARGRLDPDTIQEVEEALKRIAARLALGEDPFSEDSDQEEPDVLTIRRGFRQALDLNDGKFAARTRRYDEVKRARDKLERILGPNTPMVDALSTTSVRSVWRRLAREYANSKGSTTKRCGARQTEVTVDALYTIADWLQEENHLPPDSFKRIKTWREKLKIDWKQITGENPETPDNEKPRHSEEEMRMLFAALDDPRRRVFRVLLPTVPEHALADARWSGLTFDTNGDPSALTVHWQRRVRTKGVKRDEWASRPASQTFTLNAREREQMAGALGGYLRRLEGARAAGAIGDYPLFPAGPLLDGAVSATATTPLATDTDSVLTIDERFELAFELGGEQRMGQVIRCTRRMLKLPGIDRNVPPDTPTNGVLTPPPARKKSTQPIYLTDSQLAWVQDVLEHGYLQEYEAAYRSGRISDYPLFVAERLVRGVAKWREAPQPLSRDAALKMFCRLEAVAGVDHVDGRGWYGVRRIAADLVEDVQQDERVQDAVMANSKGTRHSIYQRKRRPEILAKAIKTREEMRTGRPQAAEAATSTEAMLAALRAAGISLTEAQIEALDTVVSGEGDTRTGTDTG